MTRVVWTLRCWRQRWGAGTRRSIRIFLILAKSLEIIIVKRLSTLVASEYSVPPIGGVLINNIIICGHPIIIFSIMTPMRNIDLGQVMMMLSSVISQLLLPNWIQD